MTNAKDLADGLMIEVALQVWKRLKTDPTADSEYLREIETYLTEKLVQLQKTPA